MKKTIKTIATATAVVSATALTVNEKAKENQETKVAQAENDAQVAQQIANPGMEINTYKHNENDAKIQVDYKNLTLE